MKLTIFQSFYGYLTAESHQELGIRVQSSNPAKRNAKKVKTEVRYGSSAKIFSLNSPLNRTDANSKSCQAYGRS